MKTFLRKLMDEKEARLSDAVYETLLEAILSNRLAPGVAVSEAVLARQLEVSRTPVHDALTQLAKDGLVRQRANHRAVVAKFSREDIYDIFEMRKLLEGEAARRAATRIDRPALAQLRSHADALAVEGDVLDWVARWTVFDEEFHEAVAQASACSRLWQDISRYRTLHRGFNKLGATRECLKQALAEHYLILEALERRDPERAGKAMSAHIQEWQAYFVNRFAH